MEKERCAVCGKWTEASQNGSKTYCSAECYEKDDNYVLNCLNEC